MKVLFLAPQPFFQERGTPIAVRLAVQVLAKRSEDTIHLLTYHEGEDITIPNVEHFRITPLLPIKDVGPGISFKKLLCDLFFFFSIMKMLWKARKEQYNLIHAVEESVFIAWLIKLFLGIPYIYDMDSSLALQVTEKWAVLRPLQPILSFFEGVVVKGSTAVVPVCDSLAVIAEQHGSQETHILRDVPQLDFGTSTEDPEDLRKLLSLPDDDVIFLYIGNLESYQGIDLLVDAFAAANAPQAELIIIGGSPEHRKMYELRTEQLGISDQVHLIGPRPVAQLHSYLVQADVLLSPRTKGNNTPMKIYPYLHSGRALLATDLPTHTQVLTPDISALAAPTASAFGTAINKLCTDKNYRDTIALEGLKKAKKDFTYEVFEQTLNSLYDQIGIKH